MSRRGLARTVAPFAEVWGSTPPALPSKPALSFFVPHSSAQNAEEWAAYQLARHGRILCLQHLVDQY
jgi:hypothetical protein